MRPQKKVEMHPPFIIFVLKNSLSVSFVVLLEK